MENLEDETIYVEGLGMVHFDDLGEQVKGDPNEDIIHHKPYVWDIVADVHKVEDYVIEGFPLPKERIEYLEHSYGYLKKILPKNTLENKVPLAPADGSFAERIEGSEDEIETFVCKVAQIMDINREEIWINIYSAPKDESSTQGSTVVPPDELQAMGLYNGRMEDGRFLVQLREDICKMSEALVATLAHEFAHVKLLGEERMQENNEEYTDMVPLFYGLGIFVANNAFRFERSNEGWSRWEVGYLHQLDWAYVFALYLEEKELSYNDVSLRYLDPTILRDIERCWKYRTEKKNQN